MLIKFFTITLHMEKRYGSSYPYIGFSGSGLASPYLYENYESHNIKISAMEKQGFIKLSPNFINWEWFSDANTLSLFMYLVLSANCTPQKWHGIVIQRGQLLTNLKELQ